MSAEPAGICLAIRHRTLFNYDAWVWNSANTLHLQPRDFQFQKTLGSLIKVLPATRLSCFKDLFGNATHHFEVARAHNKLEVESRVKVRNLPLTLSNEAYSGGMEIFQDSCVSERCWQFLQGSNCVPLLPDLWRQGLELTDKIDPVFEKAAAIMRWIYNDFSYQGGITDVNTHAGRVFELRTGVCQDFAHVMIGVCRTLGIPARYASGYIYTGERGDLVGAQASHAWCEVYLPDAGWIGFDPTNAVLADERYVKIAVGRDYEDVAPILGSYLGSANCHMVVDVVVERL